MKNFLYILLIVISACSPDNDKALLEKPSTSPAPLESKNLESDPALNRDSANLILTETFDNPNLDSDPGISDFYPEFAVDHSFSLGENIKRAGKSAGRFQINKDDPKIWSATRSELSQSQRTTRSEGWYGFSFYFPDSYVPDPSGEVVVQWHDQEDKQLNEPADRSPSNAIITSDDKIKWMLRWDADQVMESGKSDGLIYLDLGKIPKNRWVDWVVHIKYSHTNTGILEVWMDGKKVIDRQNMPNAYNDVAYPYLKFGLYKWQWGTATSKRVMYFDEVRVGNENSNYDEVKPNKTSITNKINMMVNSYTVNCYGEMEDTCLLVQEGDLIGTENWKNFYYHDSIVGFTYEPGFIYGLIVKKTEVVNPPADGSSIRYELVEIVSKEEQ